MSRHRPDAARSSSLSSSRCNRVATTVATKSKSSSKSRSTSRSASSRAKNSRGRAPARSKTRSTSKGSTPRRSTRTATSTKKVTTTNFEEALNGRGPDLAGLFLIAVAVLAALGIYSSTSGLLGRAFDEGFGWVMGVFRFVAPVLIAAAGVAVIRRGDDHHLSLIHI